MTKRIPIRDDAHWHELRSQHIGGSEVASLFNEHSSFMTKFELYTYKKGDLPPPDLDCERVFWGNVLERAIGDGIAKQKGWKVEKATDYYETPDCPRMGSTPDFLITDANGRRGILQTKCVDRLEFMKWDGTPPMRYILQVQQDIACVGVEWGVLGCLVGGNEMKIFEYDRHPGAIARMKKAISQFWEDLAISKEPDITGDDLGILKELYPEVSHETIDLSSDNQLPDLCATVLNAAARRKEAQKEEEQAKAVILQKLRDAGNARCEGFWLKRQQIHKKESYVKESTYVKLTIKEKNYG